MSAADDANVVKLRGSRSKPPPALEDAYGAPEAPSDSSDPAWRRLVRDRLQKTADGATVPNLSNLTIIIANDPALATLFAHNEFTGTNILTASPPPLTMDDRAQPGPYPRQWRSADASMVRAYIQRSWLSKAGKEDVEDAMTAVAHSRRFHPPRDWLATLTWDGTCRLENWMIHTFGIDNTPYHRAVGRRFLIAACRRVRQPGCKFDHMLVLQGAQDLGKSTACRVLFSDEWFSDSLPAQLESRDAAIGLRGIWCVEFAELEQIIRTEPEIIKAFLSRAVDRYKPMYGKEFIEQPRQSVLIGTTNSDDWLRDPTGNRRFWPVVCTKADVRWLRENREQLLAEAAHCEAAGESHWLQEEALVVDAKCRQSEHLQEDVWYKMVSEMVAYKSKTSTQEILQDMEIKTDRQTRREQMRIHSIMTSLGWKQDFERQEKNERVVRVRVWKYPQD